MYANFAKARIALCLTIFERFERYGFNKSHASISSFVTTGASESSFERQSSSCILFIRGERPVIDLKYNLLKHPNIRCTEDGGAAPYDYTAADNALDDLPGAPENYELLDMDDFLPAEAAEMKPTIQRIRRST